MKATLANNVSDYRLYHITFHDTLEAGKFALNANSFKITVKDKAGNEISNPDYVLSDAGKKDEDTFVKTLTWGSADATATLPENLNSAVVEVEFTAKLLPAATLGKPGNINTAYLEYSNDHTLDQERKQKDTTEDTEVDFVIAFTYKTEINKVDESGNALKDATFKLEKVLQSGNKETVSLDASSTATKFVFKGLDDGTYILTETKAPKGYKPIEPMTFKVTAEHGAEWTDSSKRNDVLTQLSGDAVSGTLRLTKAANLEQLTGTVTDEAIHFNVNKTQVGDNAKEVEGAKIEIFEADKDGKPTGKALDSWTSKKDETHDFGSVLETNKTYVLVETVAPKGYGYDSNITIKVDEKGNITSSKTSTKDKDGNEVYLVEDALIDFHVKKTDAGGKELDGAVISIYDEDGKLVDQFTSKAGTDHDFGEKLEAGKTYTLIEDGAPAGYKFANKVTINISNKGKVTFSGSDLKYNEKTGTYDLIDEKITVQFAKVDASDNTKMLTGAKLEILDKSGTLIHEWTSNDKPYTLPDDVLQKIKVGDTYTIRETVAPKNYSVAADTTFQIAEDGTVKYSGTKNDSGVLLVQDEKTTKGSGAITVNKYTLKKNGAFKVVNQTFYTALFSDKNLTKRVSDVKPIVLKNAYNAKVSFYGLAFGTYYVAETDQTGKPMTSSSTVSKAEVHNGTCTLSSANPSAEAIIKNTMKGGVKGAYVPVNLTIKKKVVSASGKALNVKETFYFALFTDPGFTNRVSGTSIQKVTLNNKSTGSTVFKNLPYADTFYVAEVTKSGTVIKSGSKNFGYKISYGENGLDYRGVDGGSITVTNKKTGVNGENRDKKNGQNGEDRTSGATQNAVRTGDQTPIIPMLITMLIAAAAAVFLVFMRRRMKKPQK